MIGKQIAHYKVTAKIGEGGMGEVYRATDTKLNRDVALKILPERFAARSELTICNLCGGGSRLADALAWPTVSYGRGGATRLGWTSPIPGAILGIEESRFLS